VSPVEEVRKKIDDLRALPERTEELSKLRDLYQELADIAVAAAEAKYGTRFRDVLHLLIEREKELMSELLLKGKGVA